MARRWQVNFVRGARSCGTDTRASRGDVEAASTVASSRRGALTSWHHGGGRGARMERKSEQAGHRLRRLGLRRAVPGARPRQARLARARRRAPAGPRGPPAADGRRRPDRAGARQRAQRRRACAPRVAHADVVVNLVGILAEGGKQTFEAVQAEGARNVARGRRGCRRRAAVQMSAIGADHDSAAQYARTKAAGEAAALERCAGRRRGAARPIVFGPEDDFFNRFAGMAKTLARSCP